jgi:RNA polymerase sigma-70 factor (ECF subfamily)
MILEGLRRSSLSDERLLELVGSDAEAFGEFYRRHVGWVLRFCARSTRDPEATADLTAEVFAGALLAARRFDPGRGSARNWLLGIAIHKQASFERRGAVERRARRRLGIETYALTRADRAGFDGLEQLLPDAAGPVVSLLDRLPAQTAEVVRARIIDGLSYQELAAKTGVSEAALRKRVSRGLMRLRELIGDHDG